MAIYYLNIKTIGRGSGGKATSAAAYRAGERIRDERSGRVFDHSRRSDVMHKEIVLPSKLTALDMSWARDRVVLWNAAETAERRSNARVAREYLVAVPHELTPEQRLGLVRRFSHDLADRCGIAVDFAIHAPRPHNDPRSYHAHLLTTTREVSPTGLGARTTLDLSSAERRARGIESWLSEVLSVRERWATLTNEALQQANVQARVDHRSLAAQGVDREPLPRIPIGAWRAEASGDHSDIAERIRAEYRARVQARQERAAVATPAVQNGDNLEDVRRHARQSWLRLRESEIEKARAGISQFKLEQPQPDGAKEFDAGRAGQDDDLAI